MKRCIFTIVAIVQVIPLIILICSPGHFPPVQVRTTLDDLTVFHLWELIVRRLAGTLRRSGISAGSPHTVPRLPCLWTKLHRCLSSQSLQPQEPSRKGAWKGSHARPFHSPRGMGDTWIPLRTLIPTPHHKHTLLGLPKLLMYHIGIQSNLATLRSKN